MRPCKIHKITLGTTTRTNSYKENIPESLRVQLSKEGGNVRRHVEI